MALDDARDDSDDAGHEPSRPPPRQTGFDVDVDSVGVWIFLILFLLLAYRCSGVTLW